jgi:hypothetical protein
MLSRVVLLFALAACGESLPRQSLVTNDEAVPELREACSFTEQKCTRCHTIGRVLSWDAHRREDWEPLVTRMRQMASSGITKADAEIVLRCLERRDATPRQASALAPTVTPSAQR